MNQIIAYTTEWLADQNPDIQKLNDFIQYLKDMVPYEGYVGQFCIR